MGNGIENRGTTRKIYKKTLSVNDQVTRGSILIDSKIAYTKFICEKYLFLPPIFINSSSYKEITFKIDDENSKKFMEMEFPLDETFLALNPSLLTWDQTYHGCPIESISSILRHGQILLPGDILINGNYLDNTSDSDGVENPRDAYWTTSSPSFAFKYSRNQPRVIFKLLQKSGSYTSISCNRAKGVDSMGNKFQLHKIGNYSKLRSTIYLFGLILHLDENEVKRFDNLMAKQYLNLIRMPSFNTIPTNYKCPFATECFEFLNMPAFGWPRNYFDPEGFRCYCKNCYLKGWDDYMDRSGERYVIPREWCRFGLRVSKIFSAINDIWDSWCNAYHGTTAGNAKSIVEHQGILINNDFSKNAKHIRTRASKDGRQSNYFVTPNIDYASHPWYSEINSFYNKKNDQRFGQFVLALKVRPGTYDKQRETEGGAKKIFDDYRYIKENEIEWFSKRRGCVVPYGILLRIFDEKKRKDIIRTSLI
jgi:hypothetical protein